MPPFAKRDRPRFALVSMVKDEGPYLLEWLAFHVIAGFDSILIFWNDCTDGTDRILQRLETLGLCTAVRNRVPEGRKPQPHALSLAYRRPEVRLAEWVIFLDADEFLAVKTGEGRVQDLAAALPAETVAAALVWRCHGSNGISEWAPHLVLETYPMAAPDDFARGLGVKTMWRPASGLRPGIHRPHATGSATPDPAGWVDGSGRPLDPAFVARGWRLGPEAAGRDLAEIAHYAVKGREAFLMRRARGNVNLKPDKYDASYWGVFDRTEVHDPWPARHLPAVRALLAQWRTDTVLARLETASLDHHAAQIALLRSAPGYAAEMESLRRMSAVPYDQLSEILYIHDFPLRLRTWIRARLNEGMPEQTMQEILRGIVAKNAAASARADRTED